METSRSSARKEFKVWKNTGSLNIFLLVILIIITILHFVDCLTPATQIYSLHCLYNQTHGDEWRWKNEALFGPRWSFNSQSQEDDPCSTNNMAWQGITCSSTPFKCKTTTCDIEAIDLEFYGLSGSLPIELFTLTSLTRLSLSRNQLVGSISSEVGRLSNLQILRLFTNELSGCLPSSLGSLSQLQDFWIYDNQLTGSIPSSFGSLSQLQYFFINTNLLSGSIASSLGSLSQLQQLLIYSNHITGSIPSSFGSLSQLLIFYIYTNLISGTIPSSLGSLSQLQSFYIYDNQITGPIPSTFGSLFQLQYFGIYSNHITGTIHSSFGSLSLLEYFIIYNNHVTGTIPSLFGSLLQLQYFSIYNNHITGTIHSSFGSWSQLQDFTIHRNLITGSIPSSLGSWSQLQYFFIHNNHFTGSIPSSVTQWSRLQDFSISNNQITGSIPSSLGLLSQLQYFRINENLITGSIPSSINYVTNLQVFHASNNLLTGSIPLHLTSFNHLQQLFLQQNRLTGSLDMLIFDSNDSLSITSINLTNLDVSGNELSGFIPAGLFLPSLESIALSVNCFEGELPESICDGVTMKVISMDGLNSARECKKRSTIPLTGVSLGGMIAGGIPDCVWKLSNLETLHMAGNGLRGTIGKDSYSLSSPTSSTMSKLIDLTLSHNYLSGEIPSWLLEKQNMNLLDLSHNKLTGDLNLMSSEVGMGISNDDNATDSQNQTQRSLKLAVNRLSGSSPPSRVLDAYWSLDILSGNMFGCANIPPNDENSESYVCGSSEYNRSIMVFVGIVILLLIMMGIYVMNLIIITRIHPSPCNPQSCSFSLLSPLHTCSRRYCEKTVSFFNRMMKYHRYYFYNRMPSSTSLASSQLSYCNHLGRSLVATQKLFLITTTVIIMCSIPLYVMKNVEDKSFVTHYHQYQWSFTMSYLSGSIPGVTVLIICLTGVLTFRITLWKLNFDGDQNRDTISNGKKNGGDDHVHEETPSSLHSSLQANETINVSVNSTTLQPHSCTYSRSDLFSSDEMLAGAPNSSTIPSLSSKNSLLWCYISFSNFVIVGTVNGLYIWSTLQDLSEFSRLMIQVTLSLFGIVWKVVLRSALPSRVKNSFSGMWLLSVVGVLNGVVIPCLVTSFTSPTCYQRLIIEPAEISSSYSYSTCFLWTILVPSGDRYCEEYRMFTMEVLKLIPPFTYSYQCGSTLLTSYIPVYLFSSISQILIDMFRVVLRLQTKDTHYPRFIQQRFLLPHQYLHPSKIISNLITNLMLLLSFGLSSPVLCVGICLSGVIDVSSYLILLGRVIFADKEKGGEEVGGNLEGSHAKTESGTSAGVVDRDVRKMEDGTPQNPELEMVMLTAMTERNSDHHLNSVEDRALGKVKQNAEDSVKKLLEEIKDHVNDAMVCVERCKWLVITPSCLLMTLLSWDVAGDEEGWDGSYWIALLGVGVMIVIASFDYFLSSFKPKILNEKLTLAPNVP